jgi:two-component system, cell cycle sensor histidine kinase DivJ
VTETLPYTSALKPASRLARVEGVVWWNLAWLGALAVAALALAFTVGLEGPPAAALALGAAPALLFVSRLAGRWSRRISLFAWGICVTAAIVLTGGVAGPLSAWHLAPLAAAAAMGQVRRLALGAAVSIASVGASAVAGATLDMFIPDPGVSLALGLTAAATTALGLSAALIMLQRHVLEEERARNQADARLQRVLATQPHALAAIYPGGRIASAWGLRPPGVECDLAANRQIADVAAEGDRARIQEALREAMEAGRAEVGFVPVNAPDAWLVLSLRRTGSSGLVGALRDATADRDRERELEAAREAAEARSAGKSRFLAGMSHELRTPLNAIMGFSDIMRQRLFGPMPDRYGEYADLIHDSGAHLLDLINDILDMSKIEAERFELNRERFDAREAVSGVLRLMRGQADRAGVQLRGELPKEPLLVDADRRALKQIVLNLVSNAVKFTPQGGGVSVIARAAGQDLQIVVADTGAGIAPEDLQRIGRPFEQAGDPEKKAAGTGLGLSLVRAFAELHGGDMTLESRLGEGTVVRVRLPVVLTA